MVRNMKEASGLRFASAPARLTRRIRQRKQPVQERSQATTEALLEATLQVLVRHGYPALTTTKVAERAGVSVGTLYQYFPDKRSLVTALKVRYFGLMVDSVLEAVKQVEHAPFDISVRRMLAALLAVKRENLELSLALRGPMAEFDGAGFMREISQAFVGAVVRLLERSMPSLLDKERRAALMVAALNGAISTAVFEAPDWLSQPWFLDDLVALAVGFARQVRH